MVEEIKIAEGYKQTEVGVIPEDWEINKQKDIVRYINGRAYSIHEWEKNGIPVVRLQNLTNKGGTFYYSNLKLPDYQYMEKGDLIFMWSASFGPYIWWGDKAIFHYHIWKIECKEGKVDKGFYYYKLVEITETLKKGTSGSTMLHLTKSYMEDYLVAIPPTLTEQTAIATALSDMDILIEDLEKLLVKKRNIKQGTMQELLTPKEGWKQEKLPTVCWFQEGPGLRNWQFTKQGIKVINVTNLVNGVLDLSRTDRHISMEEFEKMYKHFEIDDKDIVMASSGNSYSKVAVVRKQDLRLLMNTSVIRFKPLNGLDYNYLLIFLKSNLFKDQIDLMITGGAQPNFGPYHLKRINILLPPTKEEQSNIGNILSDMDSEIQKLETQLSKYKMLKIGMMQELLNGKKRLI